MATKTKTETTNDPEHLIGTGAIKYDADKPCAFRGLVDYFPRALEAVAEVSTFGARKYAWKGWENVDDGINRYSDAMMRHFLRESRGETVDPDSSLLHAAHTAWGALARLELILRDAESLEDWLTSPDVKEMVDYINTSVYLTPQEQSNVCLSYMYVNPEELQ
jgi:hypothetical protein